MSRFFSVGWQRSGLPLATALLVSGLVAVTYGQDDRSRGERERWDPAEFLDRLDRDDNGVLSPSEMEGRSGRFIRGLGFDTSGNVPVQAIIQKIEKDRQVKAEDERRQQIDADRKVPKFGEPVDLPPVPGFGAGNGLPGDEGNIEENYPENIVQVVRAYMERYDENGDGFLSGESETRRISRIVDDMRAADANQDGRYSPMELAAGYQQQQQRQQAANNKDAAAEERNRREAEVSRSSRREVRSSSSASSSSSGSRSMSARASSYVEGVFRKYDTNKDGNLTKDERKNLRVPFTDPDGDGIISRQEAVAYVSGTRKSGGSVSPAARAERDPSSGRGPRGGDGAGDGDRDGSDVRRDLVLNGRTVVPAPERSTPEDDLRQSGASRDFLKLDRNGDGQLQMVEFADGRKFTDKIYQEFVAADANDDGVITPGEFSD